MASVAQEFEGVFISYKDVKDANPSWSDKTIEDYLSIKRNLLLTAESGVDFQDQIDVINIRLDALEALKPTSVLASSDYDSLGNEIITCVNTATITIKLILSPDDQQRCTIKRTIAKVILNGNGKLIDGASSVTMNRKNTGLDLVYSTAAGFWSIV